jgi:hypothetical protein
MKWISCVAATMAWAWAHAAVILAAWKRARLRWEELPWAEAKEAALRVCAELQREEWLLAARAEELASPREEAPARRVRVVSARAVRLVVEVSVDPAAAWE